MLRVTRGSILLTFTKSTLMYSFRQYIEISLPTAMLILVSACSNQPAEKADSNSSNQSDALVKACLETTNMGETLCKCTSDKANQELSEDGYAFLVASLTQNESETERLRSKLTLEELMKAGLFMTKGPADCAAEAAGIERERKN